MKRYYAEDAVGQACVLFVDDDRKAVFINETAFDEELTLEVAIAADYSNFDGCKTAEEAAANYYTGENLIDFNEEDWIVLVEFDENKRLVIENSWFDITSLEAVAENPSTPAAVLEALANDDDKDVRMGVAMNPNTPTATLEMLSKDESWEVRMGAAGNPNTPATALEALAKDGYEDVRWKVAENQNTPTTALETLAKDQYPDVRMAVAFNENTSTATLEMLSKDKSWEVRMEVARNPNTSVATLKLLAQDEDSDVRMEVANNKSMSAATLDKQSVKLVMSASDLKEAKAEKDVRDTVAQKGEQHKKTEQEL